MMENTEKVYTIVSCVVFPSVSKFSLNHAVTWRDPINVKTLGYTLRSWIGGYLALTCEIACTRIGFKQKNIRNLFYPVVFIQVYCSICMKNRRVKNWLRAFLAIIATDFEENHAFLYFIQTLTFLVPMFGPEVFFGCKIR